MANPYRASSPQAVVLLSGGIDSATCAALAVRRGFQVHALTVEYGQTHRAELEAAARIARYLGLAGHHVLRVDLRAIARSALLGTEPIPKDRPVEAGSPSIPPTYVPARNTILLSLALSLAESIGASDIFLGANVVDYSGYPDCRPQFLAAFEQVANLGTQAATEGKCRFTIHAPLLFLTKGEIIRLGLASGLDYSLTLSCYDPTPEGLSCGRCDSCQIRKRGFAEAGVPDPTRYATT